MQSTILVVEDEPAIAEPLSVNLGFAGHKVLVAENAEIAQSIVEGQLPDLILLDWMLPGMSGVRYARKLRTDERTKEIPIIMLTARTDEDGEGY